MKRSKMLIFIIMMSVNVFVLAFSALLLPKYVKEKDETFLTDNYYIIRFEDNLPVEEAERVLQKNAYKHLVVNYAGSQCRAIEFSKEQFEEMGVAWKDSYSNLEREDVALVNLQYDKMCYDIDGEQYIFILGKEYKVLSQFDMEHDAVLKETAIYVNSNGPHIKSNSDYDCLFVDFKENTSREEITKVAEQFENIEIQKWEGYRFNLMDSRESFVLIIAMCGFLIFLNCIIFAKSWIEQQYEELEIRKKIGATTQTNFSLLMMRYIGIFSVASVCGIVVSFLEFMLLKRISWLHATRELFGTEIHMEVVYYACLCVFLFGLVIILLQYLVFDRRMQKKNVKNDKIWIGRNKVTEI